MSKTATSSPERREEEHVSWCVWHDEGLTDRTCNGDRFSLTPAESPELEPGRVWIQAFRYSSFAADYSTWNDTPPQIELSVEGLNGTSTSTLSPAEARRVAAELLNAAEAMDGQGGHG